jgi:hypothetical protein
VKKKCLVEKEVGRREKYRKVSEWERRWKKKSESEVKSEIAGVTWDENAPCLEDAL